jgi:hypothetical protein
MARSRKGTKGKRPTRTAHVPPKPRDNVAETMTLRGRITNVVAVIFRRKPPAETL